KPHVLVIVGKSIGEAGGQQVFQGVEGFRWQQPEKGSAAATDDAKNVVSGPGRLANEPFDVTIGSGDTAKTLKLVGERLAPFTWEQIQPLTARNDREPPVGGLVVPGEGFAATVFKLSAGELGATLNQPMTVAYVVQVTGYDYLLDAVVYPADTDLEKSPSRAKFIADYTSAMSMERQF